MSRWLIVGLLALGAGAASADPYLQLHATAPDYGGCSAIADQSIRCGSIVVDGGSQARFVWVLVADAPTEIGGVQFGLKYDAGIGAPTWTGCATGAEIPGIGWPGSDTGVAMTWAAGCYSVPGQFAKIGFLSVGAGASGVITTRDHPEQQGVLAWANCDTEVSDFCAFGGSVGFGSTDGYAPDDCECAGPPVRERTWGRIKESYR